MTLLTYLVNMLTYKLNIYMLTYSVEDCLREAGLNKCADMCYTHIR